MPIRAENVYEQYLSSTGVVLAGGKVKFTENNDINTTINIWSDYALTTPATNPYVLDNSGRIVGDVFIDDTVVGLYQQNVYDSNDVFQYSISNLGSPIAGSASSSTENSINRFPAGGFEKPNLADPNISGIASAQGVLTNVEFNGTNASTALTATQVSTVSRAGWDSNVGRALLITYTNTWDVEIQVPAAQSTDLLDLLSYSFFVECSANRTLTIAVEACNAKDIFTATTPFDSDTYDLTAATPIQVGKAVDMSVISQATKNLIKNGILLRLSLNSSAASGETLYLSEAMVAKTSTTPAYYATPPVQYPWLFLDDDIITTAMIQDNAITTAKVADSQITAAKLNLNSTNYNIESAKYLSGAFLDASSECGASANAPTGILFNDDGLSLYLWSRGGETIWQYTLTTAYDVTTATYATKSFDTSTQTVTTLEGVCFGKSGEKMYVSDGSDNIYEYDLSPAYDVSSASYTTNTYNPTLTNVTLLQMNDTGSKLFFAQYAAGNSTVAIRQLDLSTPYDLSTASDSASAYTTSVGYGAGVNQPICFQFEADGETCWVGNRDSGGTYFRQSLMRLSLTTGFNITTATEVGLDSAIEYQDTLAVPYMTVSEGGRYLYKIYHNALKSISYVKQYDAKNIELE